MRHPPRSILLPFLLFFAMVGALAGFFPASSARAQYCGEYTPATISVFPRIEELKTDHNRSVAEISTMAREKRSLEPDEWWNGMTDGKIVVVVKTLIATVPYEGGTCGRVQEVVVELSLTDNVIYVAREFPKSTCSYETVMAHEKRHKDIDYAAIEEYGGKAKDYFAQIAEKIGAAWQPGDNESFKAQVDSIFRDATQTFSQEMDKDLRNRQNEVDTPEEYERVGQACDGELAEIVRRKVGSRNNPEKP